MVAYWSFVFNNVPFLLHKEQQSECPRQPLDFQLCIPVLIDKSLFNHKRKVFKIEGGLRILPYPAHHSHSFCNCVGKRHVFFTENESKCHILRSVFTCLDLRHALSLGLIVSSLYPHAPCLSLIMSPLHLLAYPIFFLQKAPRGKMGN